MAHAAVARRVARIRPKATARAALRPRARNRSPAQGAESEPGAGPPPEGQGTHPPAGSPAGF
jgi:hypothetical protein